MNKTKKIALAAAALCASFSAMAQEPVINPSWYVQPSVSGIKPDDDFGIDKRGPGAGLKFGKAVNENWDVQLGGTYARSKDNGNRYQQQTLGVDGLYLFSRKTFRPFILVGAGVQRDKLALVGQSEITKNSPYLSAGLGFQADFNDRTTFQADIRNVHGFLRDDAFPRTDKSNNLYLTVGVNFAFAAPPRPAPPPPPPAPVVAEPPPPPAPVAPPPPPPPRFEKVTLSATELFGFDSAKLNPNQPKLDEIATVLNNNPGIDNVTIAGYADRLGNAKYNEKLSERRANSVRSALLSMGVGAERVAMRGYGEAFPVAPNDTASNRALNRRVEIVLSNEGQPISPRR